MKHNDKFYDMLLKEINKDKNEKDNAFRTFNIKVLEDLENEIYRNRKIGRLHCPECSHIINDEDVKKDKCPNCKRETLMRRLTEKDV